MACDLAGVHNRAAPWLLNLFRSTLKPLRIMSALPWNASRMSVKSKAQSLPTMKPFTICLGCTAQTTMFLRRLLRCSVFCKHQIYRQQNLLNIHGIRGFDAREHMTSTYSNKFSLSDYSNPSLTLHPHTKVPKRKLQFRIWLDSRRH